MDILNIDPKVLLVQVGGFVLLAIIFKLFLFGPILNVLDKRRTEVEGTYGDAENLRQAASDMKAQYEKHLSEIEEEMRSKIAEAMKEGQTMRDEIIADSRGKAESILTKAQEDIQREKEKAMTELRTKAADIAIDAAGKLIEEKLDHDKHRQLVSSFIDNLGEVKQ